MRTSSTRASTPKKDGADWRTVKEKWLAEMRVVVGSEGNVVDVILESVPKSAQPADQPTNPAR